MIAIVLQPAELPDWVVWLLWTGFFFALLNLALMALRLAVQEKD